ncbi:hypothetical protein DOY81_010926, partial [Sarcophaga bullata]
SLRLMGDLNLWWITTKVSSGFSPEGVPKVTKKRISTKVNEILICGDKWNLFNICFITLCFKFRLDNKKLQ